jgi:hypothetical protein
MSTKLSERVAELEADVAELKKLVRPRSDAPEPANDAWRETFGAFKDDPIYEDVVRLGRAWRKRQPKC